MHLIPFEKWHLAQVVPQPAQANADLSGDWVSDGVAWTAVDGGSIVACGGLLSQWEGRHVAWLLIGCGGHLHAIVKAARRVLCSCAARRIEATVSAQFTQARKLVEMLGFDFEGTLKAYGPGGEDFHMFARVNR